MIISETVPPAISWPQGDGPEVEDAQRELLGFTAMDQEHIMDSVLTHLDAR